MKIRMFGADWSNQKTHETMFIAVWRGDRGNRGDSRGIVADIEHQRHYPLIVVCPNTLSTALQPTHTHPNLANPAHINAFSSCGTGTSHSHAAKPNS